MNRQVRVHPLVGLLGITAVAGALVTVPALDGTGMRGKAVAGVTENKIISKVLPGQVMPMGDGSIRSWVKVDAAGYPTAVGVTFGEAALVNLPKGKAKPKHATCCDGPAFELPLPAVQGLPFTHAWVNWNPNGHEPDGVYDVPHFDFHFYMQPSAEREAITAEGEDLAKCAKSLPAEQIPAGYVMAPGGVPKMGGHWVLASTPEFHGQPFTKTFIYGSYDGKMTFLEPMITKAYLETRPEFEEELVCPKTYPSGGFWPTRYSIKFDKVTREYTVALSGMERK